MGSTGKHIGGSGSSRMIGLGKHAAPEQRRLRILQLVAVSIAVVIAVVGSMLVLRGAATSPSAAGEALTVSSSESSPAAELSIPGIKRLVVYGHSMPLGGGASDPSLGYPVLAAETLGLRLVNRAQGGTSAANATQTMEAAGPAGPHDALVLHTGMNDIFRRGDGAVGRGRQAIRHFLEETSKAGRRVIVLECQPGSWKYTPQERNLQSALDSWNAMLREEAAAWPDVQLLDTCYKWNPRRFTNVQRYHPNDVGHARLASDLATLLASS